MTEKLRCRMERAATRARRRGGMASHTDRFSPPCGVFLFQLRTREDGSKERTLLECHRAKDNAVGGVERCYDLSERQFPRAKAASVSRNLPRGEEQSALFLPFHVEGHREHLARIARVKHGRARGLEPHGKIADEGPRRLEVVVDGGGGRVDELFDDYVEELVRVEGQQGGQVGDDEHDDGVTSVHLRMSSVPVGTEW